MDHLKREVRHAVRRLMRTPGFTAAAVFTLALAIGANTAIFALLHRIALSPLPFPAAERLIDMDHGAPGVGISSRLGLNPGLYREYRKLPSIEAVAMYNGGEWTLTGTGDPEHIEALASRIRSGSRLSSSPGCQHSFRKTPGPRMQWWAKPRWVRYRKC